MLLCSPPHLLEENRDVCLSEKTDNFLSWDVCIIKFHILAISFQNVKLLGGRERERDREVRLYGVCVCVALSHHVDLYGL